MAVPLVVAPGTLVTWRALIAEFEAARHVAGGHDRMRAAAAGLLGSVRAVIDAHDAEQAKRTATD